MRAARDQSIAHNSCSAEQQIASPTATLEDRLGFKIPFWTKIALPVAIAIPFVVNALIRLDGSAGHAGKPQESKVSAADRWAAIEGIPDKRPDDGRIWRRVATFDSRGGATSGEFRTNSATWRLQWQVTGAISLKVYEKSGKLIGSFQKAVNNQTAEFATPAGEFYFRVQPGSPQVKWRVNVDE